MNVEASVHYDESKTICSGTNHNNQLLPTTVKVMTPNNYLILLNNILITNST